MHVRTRTSILLKIGGPMQLVVVLVLYFIRSIQSYHEINMRKDKRVYLGMDVNSRAERESILSVFVLNGHIDTLTVDVQKTPWHLSPCHQWRNDSPRRPRGAGGAEHFGAPAGSSSLQLLGRP